MRFSFLLPALLIVPVIASAEPFTSAYDLSVPTALTKVRPVLVELSPEMRLAIGNTARIINSHNVAVAFDQLNDQENLLPKAQMDESPLPADTLPKTTVDMLRDGNNATAFQPQTAQTLQMRFHFPDDVFATSLVYQLESGTVSNVHVRTGNDASSLHDAYVGVPSGNRIELSAERSRVFEVTIAVQQGVLRMKELQLLQPRTRLIFAGTPQEHYRLLFGAGIVVNPQQSTVLSVENAIIATAGTLRAAHPDEQVDHDGIDAGDNCPVLWNTDQADTDGDGMGNRCDNCPGIANTDQADTNRNGMGDLCEDTDNDGVMNVQDNCPKIYNPGQQNEDKDMVGDACDTSDSRFSANKPWLLWGSMAVMIIALVAIGGVILGRTRKV